MHTHPQGPSATNLLCPKNAPLGEFSNNTAHSLGWFELWTFEDYFPIDGEIVITVLSHFILHLPYCKVEGLYLKLRLLLLANKDYLCLISII